jgi:diguanylate cyclase
MPAAPLPNDEIARLSALTELRVLDSSPEEEFDALVQAAALICNTPISLISLVDAERQWFKANVGLPGATETHRDMAFCAHAIHNDGIFEVEDAALDSRFIDNPLVTSQPSIRFYAGAVLALSSGARVGTLCVIDTKPQKLNDIQRAVLGHLAKAAVKALEGRRALLVENSNAKQIAELANSLYESEARFRTLSDASPLGVYATDANGNCTYTNHRWQEIYGISFEESLGEGWQRGLHPEDIQRVFSTWCEHAPRGLEFDMEFRTQHKNGNICFVHSRAKPQIDHEGKIVGFVGSVADITLQKKFANENAALINAIRTQFIMSITDIHGNIMEVNDAFCDISQFSREELIGSSHSVVNSRYHPRSFFIDMWKAIIGGKSWRGEICNRAKNGTLYWVDSVITPLVNIEGKVDRYISIRSDITARKLQENELRKSQTLLARTGEIAGVGGWEVDLSTGAIYWSEETCRIHGVPIDYRPTLDEAINFYAPEARPVIQAAVGRGVQYGESWDLELPFIQANGNSIWVRAVGSVEFVQETPIRIVGAFQNITDLVSQRKNIEEANTRFALATDSGGIGIWEYDVTTGIMVWDDWMYRIYGLSPAEAEETYQMWQRHLHPDDKAMAEKAVADAITGVAPFDTEFRIIWNDNSIHYIRGTAQIQYDDQGRPQKMVGVNWDVSRLRKLAAELAEQHELLRVTLQSIGDAVITTDAQGNTEWLNPVAERMTGWSVDEAKGRPLSQIFHIVNEDTRLQTENPVATCLIQGKTVGLANHTVLISRNGDEFGIEDSAAPIRSAAGELLGVVLVFHDVTEQRRLSGEVSYQATHDILTGLVNRAEFETRLRRILHQSHEDKSHHALMYIDLDQFKIVNDTCGHSVGDQLLQQVSRVLKEAVRTRDTLARLGGDEFGVILEHCSTDQAQRVAQYICEKMENFRFIHGAHRFRIGASIGLVSMDNRWPTIAALMQAADTSCYAAKDGGRNRVHTWCDTDQAIRLRQGEMQWTTRIERALDENRFALYVQLLTDLKNTTNGIHAEVLVRMIDTDGTMFLPGVFLPAAERFHLATRIDRWVLRNSLDWLLLRPDRAQEIEMLCINFSGQSVGDRSFHRQAIEMLIEAGANICQKICIEITETSAITNLADASFFIEQLRDLGIQVALDDFGAGASSFGYLKNLSVNILKIDGQFIKDLLDDPLDDAAVRCFVDVARLIGLKTVAEFVDKPAVLARVKELGIDYAQGFLLHTPEPINKVLERTLNPVLTATL